MKATECKYCVCGKQSQLTTVRVKHRTGLLWNVIFWLVLFTVTPLQLVCLWLSKGLVVLSDLLRELCCRAWFKQTIK